MRRTCVDPWECCGNLRCHAFIMIYMLSLTVAVVWLVYHGLESAVVVNNFLLVNVREMRVNETLKPNHRDGQGDKISAIPRLAGCWRENEAGEVQNSLSLNQHARPSWSSRCQLLEAQKLSSPPHSIQPSRAFYLAPKCYLYFIFPYCQLLPRSCYVVLVSMLFTAPLHLPFLYCNLSEQLYTENRPSV